MNIQIYPLEKVVVDDIEICLGMERSVVEMKIGKGIFAGERYYYYNNELAVSYDDANKAEYIEFLGGIDGTLKPVIFGVSVFEADAEQVFSLLQTYNGNDNIADTERGYAYCFKKLGVGIYREAVLEDILQMVQEAKEDGNPMSDTQIQYEQRKAKHWACIGIGTAAYFG